MEKKSSCYPGKLMLCDFWKHLECSQNGVICVYWELHQVRGGVMGSQGTKFKVSLMVFLLLISKQLSSVSSGVFLVFLGCRLVYPAGRSRSRKQWKHCWFLQSSGEVSNEKVVLFFFFFVLAARRACMAPQCLATAGHVIMMAFVCSPSSWKGTGHCLLLEVENILSSLNYLCGFCFC